MDLEESIIYLILQNNKLINELYIKDELFENKTYRQVIKFLRIYYKKENTLDMTTIANDQSVKEGVKNPVIEICSKIILDDTILAIPSQFYTYQEEMLDRYKNKTIKKIIKKFEDKEISDDDLVESINKIKNETLITKCSNKVTPEEMISMVRNKEKLIEFNKFDYMNNALKIKKRTINVIGARPSEGKSALALNLFEDLLNNYKCLYFNMEMTETEVYERLLGIMSELKISDVIAPKTERQEQIVKNTATLLYGKQYEVINGSKTIQSIKSKIIREQKDGHVIVFIDYVGYIVGKAGQSDKDRIGEAVRELNNITKDYDCTIFLIAQINRNGSDLPTMQDLKDSGEIEQTADTIMLIHDRNKEDTSSVKEIQIIIPKCRGGNRNIAIPIIYDKEKQIMEVKRYGR